MAALTPGPAPPAASLHVTPWLLQLHLIVTLWLPPSDSSGLYTSTVLPSPSFTNAALLPHPRLQTSYPPSTPFVSSFSAPSPLPLAPGCPSTPPASPGLSQGSSIECWSSLSRSTELLHFLSSHPVDLICIQESNLISSSSFWIPGLSTLRSDHTHSWSGILSCDAMHTTSNIMIFVTQGLSFSELSTSALSSLDLYSDYVGINISLNNSYSLPFLNVYASPICSSPTDSRTDSFSLSPLNPFGTQKVLPHGKKVFSWVISSDLLPLNGPDIPTLLHCTSGSCSSPDISFAPLLSRPFLLLGGASGPRFWSSTNSSICPSLSSPLPHQASPYLQFSKNLLGWHCFLLWLTLSFCRGTLVSFLWCYSLHFPGTKCSQIFHSFQLHRMPS